MKNLQKLINSIAYIGKSYIEDDDAKVYYSKTDGSYLTRVGMEKSLNYLLKHGITEQIQAAVKGGKVACIGFNPKEEKWYGWSHRAIYGFGIGSECKQGDCGFKPRNKEEFMQKALNWHGDADMKDTYKKDATVKEYTRDGVLGVLVEFVYDDTVPNIGLRGQITGAFEAYPKEFGRGEWTAKTLAEAKLMAIDFAHGVD